MLEEHVVKLFSQMQRLRWDKKNTPQAVVIVPIYRTRVRTCVTCYCFKHHRSVDGEPLPDHKQVLYPLSKSGILECSVSSPI